MHTINFKGKPSPKDKNLVKIEMVFFKTGYARVVKVVNITGPNKLWSNDTQSFSSKKSDLITTNNFLSNLRLKYLKVAEEWESEGKIWSPVQWSHCFDTIQAKKEEIKVVTVHKMIEAIIKRSKEKERLKNGQIVTSTKTSGYYLALKNHLIKFTQNKYNKAFGAYYFEDIKEEFLEDFLFYLRKNGVEKGHNGGVDSYLRKFYGVFYYANKAKIPGADLDIFECVRLEMKHKKYEPKTIPIEVMNQIENIDRSLLTEKEDLYLDLYLFCFYCGGIAPIDIAFLTWDCIKDGVITYERMKTPKKAVTPFLGKAKAIAYKHRNACFGNYVLPVFTHKQKEEWQKRARLMRISLKVNELLAKIAMLIKYDGKITWYSARGTFITKMIDKGYHPAAVAGFAGNSPLTIYNNYFKQTRIEEVMQDMENSF
ncbi:MAG: site-specific integrase [Prevotella sp.]|jgi:integrase|nr:site-specific integrase [Prevotella sp.]